jgi:hypothetical protein
MAKASPIQNTFNAGEFSKLLDGRTDIAKYPNACGVMENYHPSVQGPAIRRGGTRFVNEIKTSANRTWLVKFEFNTQQAYVLEFGDGYIRFFTNHGQLLTSGVTGWVTATPYVVGDLRTNGGITYYCTTAHTSAALFATDLASGYWYAQSGSIYEIPSPYSAADMTNTDGTFRLRYVQSGDIIYIAHPLYAPRKLSRFGSTNWTLTALANTGGPFSTINADTTITVYASAATGTGITLTASSAIFQAAHVGALFYLGEKDVRSTVQWEAGKAYAINALVRSDNKNYQAVNAATSGGVKPIHTSGAVYDGTTGVQWTFLDPGYGYVQITGFTSSTVVTANVIKRLPANAVLVANATSYWAMGAWNGVDGYPAHVTFFRERLTFAGTLKLWFSVSGDYENFSTKDSGGNIVADQAINIQVVSKEVNSIQWVDPGNDLLIGTAGGEFVCKELTRNQAFGPGNVTIEAQTQYGSKSMAPRRVGLSVLYVQRGGTKIREMAYDYGPDNYKSTNLTVLAEHVTGLTGVVDSTYQQEPYSLVWYARADGSLIAITFDREQDVVGWHRHPVGGSGTVEAVLAIPTPDTIRNEVWMIVKRTINGATKRYIEYIEVEHRLGDDPESAFYVDCGLTYNGQVNATLTPGAGATVAHTLGVVFTASIASFVIGDIGREIHYRYTTTGTDVDGKSIIIFKTAKALITAFTDTTHVTCTINAAFPSLSVIAANGWRMTATVLSGLSHLEGQTVDVLINGATHPQRTVNGGSITLQSPASYVQVGLQAIARLRTMRFNAGGADGTSQGKTARVNKVAIRVEETLGLKYGARFDNLDEVPFRNALQQMDNPPDLYTGDIVVDWPGDYDTNPWLCIQADQPLPSTIVALMPQVQTQDR